MAFSSAAVAGLAGANIAIFNVIASADADTGGTVTHGLTLPGGVAIPAPASILAIAVPIVQTTAALSLWAVTGKSATTITLTKATTTGSGGAAAQLFLIVILPHTIIQ